MGYNHQSVFPIPASCFPFFNEKRLKPEDEVTVPPTVERIAGSRPHHQRAQMNLDQHDVIGRGSYVVVRSQDESFLVGWVDSLWEVMWPQGSVMMVQLLVCKIGDMDGHYQMRRIERMDEERTVNAEHNCAQAECVVSNTKVVYKERRECATRADEVRHMDHTHFIINSASLKNSELHRTISDLPLHDVTPEEWVNCIREGLAAWGQPQPDIE
ncbi:hypothetical protein PGT21_027740 [Puccinia graminis f. sp. tritici]|uniref:Uncharacterized protein n=2 Tax=Puccinia graminis f. sp. tritici TaxID=56615 RepID=A0A5B0PEH3_PUCGR|nr:hypothetical protein PGT21_027740 [Puccinia graminis f. sp. tritici]